MSASSEPPGWPVSDTVSLGGGQASALSLRPSRICRSVARHCHGNSPRHRKIPFPAHPGSAKGHVRCLPAPPAESPTRRRRTGKLLPERLLQLYRDRTAIQSAGFELEKPGKKRWRPKRWPVYCFEPLDTESLNALPYEEELGPGFCFATTGRSSWYWIAASDQRAKDSPVIFLDYDGGRSHGETVAETLEEFLNLPRLPVT